MLKMKEYSKGSDYLVLLPTVISSLFRRATKSGLRAFDIRLVPLFIDSYAINERIYQRIGLFGSPLDCS